jgi:hypothetical protein
MGAIDSQESVSQARLWQLHASDSHTLSRQSRGIFKNSRLQGEG